MSKEDNYLFKVIGSMVMRYSIEKPDPETLAIAQKIISLVEKATEERIIKLLEANCSCEDEVYCGVRVSIDLIKGENK